MERRTLIKNGIAVSSALILPSWLKPEAKMAPGSVVRVTGDSPYDITRRAIAEMGGMDQFVSKRDVVVIKPNIGWNRVPEQAGTTNPDVVRALVELAYTAGAKKVIVMDNTLHKAEDAYSRSGIQAAASKSGAEVRFADDNRLVSHDFKGENIQKWPVFRDFLEADKFINVPILKHHGSAGLTVAMKNVFGILGGNRGKLHRDMAVSIADMANGFHQHLVVVDAYRVLMRNGPVGGRLSDVEFKKTVIVSTNVMHADVAAAVLFGLNPRELEFLQAGFERKMGEIDPAKIATRSVTI
jgi:uncharacterized protein (DUF362 family)